MGLIRARTGARICRKFPRGVLAAVDGLAIILSRRGCRNRQDCYQRAEPIASHLVFLLYWSLAALNWRNSISKIQIMTVPSIKRSVCGPQESDKPQPGTSRGCDRMNDLQASEKSHDRSSHRYPALVGSR